MYELHVRYTSNHYPYFKNGYMVPEIQQVCLHRDEIVCQISRHSTDLKGFVIQYCSNVMILMHTHIYVCVTCQVFIVYKRNIVFRCL